MRPLGPLEPQSSAFRAPGYLLQLETSKPLAFHAAPAGNIIVYGLPPRNFTIGIFFEALARAAQAAFHRPTGQLQTAAASSYDRPSAAIKMIASRCSGPSRERPFRTS